MKSKFAKVTAVALATTMCVPFSAMAQTGTFKTSFDLYSPKLTVSVPVNADIRVNPLAASDKTDVGKFEVASNSLDIVNASVDVENDKEIPVNITVKAKISKQGADVITKYNTFTANKTSTSKKINLNLSKAQTPAVLGAAKKADGSAETAAFGTGENAKLLDLTKFAVATPAVYTTPAESVAITKWGSSLSVDIAGPATTDTTSGATFSSDATKVTPKVGSFAVTGVANVNADWKADDIAVDLTYDLKASAARSITTPKLAAQSPANADSDLVLPAISGVGEATVTAIAVHNDESTFKDFIWEEDGYSVAYDPTANSGAGTATITIKKEGGLKYMFDNDKGVDCDLAIALSDGRMVVTTLKVGTAGAASN